MVKKMSNNERRNAKASAETAALAEVRHAADKKRELTEKLRQQRAQRDAALPAKKKAAPKKQAATGLNLAKTQQIAKK